MEGQKFESPTSYFMMKLRSHGALMESILHIHQKGLADCPMQKALIPIYFFMIVNTGKEVNITEGQQRIDKIPVFSPDGSMIAYQSMERDGYESDLDRLLHL
jgi:hypothetical protein